MKVNTEIYDLVLVEPKMSQGHLNFYNDYIKQLTDAGKKVLFISSKDYCKTFEDIIGLSIISIDYKKWNPGPFNYRFFQIKFLLTLMKFIKGINYDKLIFLSYETISIAIFSKIFRHEFSVIEHNNIDDVNSNSFKQFFYRLISRDVEHLVFENYIRVYLTNSYNKKVGLISHPLRRVKPSKTSPFDVPYVFCPSIDCSESFLIELASLCENKGWMLICKNKFILSRFTNVIQSGFFDNYDQLFYHATHIAVGVDFEYRISGVFYECVANNKKIIMNNCFFSRVMKDEYPLSIEYILGK